MTIHNGVSNPILLEFVVAATTDIVTAVSGKKIRVLAMSLSGVAGNATLQTDTTDLFGPVVVATGPVVLPFMASGWFETDSGEKLRLVLSASDKTGGSITYILV